MLIFQSSVINNVKELRMKQHMNYKEKVSYDLNLCCNCGIGFV